MSRTVLADHALLGDAPPIARARIVVADDGTIEAVDALSPEAFGAAREGKGSGADEGKESAFTYFPGVVFPGVVNAHTHVELSGLRGKLPPGRGFVAWLDALVGTRGEAAPEEDTAAIDVAADELARAATVAVGEVTNSLAAVGALARRGIEGCIFHEVFGQNRDDVLRRAEGLRAILAERYPTWPVALHYAPAPHTLYTTHQDAVRALVDAAAKDGARTSLHLAEHAGERRAVEHGDGPMAEWFEARTRSKPEWPKVPLLDLADSVGALREGVLLVHLTDARKDELERIAKSGASVVLCPRSNLFIEARLPPLLAVLAAGIAPALGTDSLASNTSLDVLAEAQALAERFPSVPRWQLFKMASWNGAVALGKPHLGRIANGARPGLFGVEGGGASGESVDPAAIVLATAKSTAAMLTRRCLVAPSAAGGSAGGFSVEGISWRNGG